MSHFHTKTQPALSPLEVTAQNPGLEFQKSVSAMLFLYLEAAMNPILLFVLIRLLNVKFFSCKQPSLSQPLLFPVLRWH